MWLGDENRQSFDMATHERDNVFGTFVLRSYGNSVNVVDSARLNAPSSQARSYIQTSEARRDRAIGSSRRSRTFVSSRSWAESTVIQQATLFTFLHSILGA